MTTTSNTSPDPAGPPLHEAVEPFAFLLGATQRSGSSSSSTWRGAGQGEYPTITPFAYNEEITFSHVGKPFLAYTQRTSHPETGAPMHAESGYWRPVGDGRLEVVLAHPTGILESLSGTFEATEGGGIFALGCDAVGLTDTAVSVTETSRRFEVDGDELTYDFSMAAVGLPLTHHLRATLRRV